MKLSNVKAVIWNDLTVIKRVQYRMVELLYFPFTGILIWGLFALHSKQYALEAGLIVLVVNLFWIFADLAQKQANILMMEDVWSSSFRQVFVSGITEIEYIIAKLVMSTGIAIPLSFILAIIANAFGAPVFANFGLIAKLAGIALIGSLGLAVIVTGMIVTFGREYSFFSWTLLQLFIFLSAPFYSPDVFPWFIRWITEIMPFTRVFEMARQLAVGAPIEIGLIKSAFIVCLAYFILSWPFLKWAFRRARKNGMLVRMAM